MNSNEAQVVVEATAPALSANRESSSRQLETASVETASVEIDMAKTLRVTMILLVTLVAACLFSVIRLAGDANANVIPQNATTTWANNTAGAHSDLEQYTQFTYNTATTDDLRNLVIDFPAGQIGDPNAIPAANRCGTDYTGVPASDSPSYASCTDANKVGEIRVSANSSVCGNITLDGDINLLRNRPTADPEVPTRLGITVSGSACLFLTATISMTAEITLRPEDNGLRIRILDDITRTDPIIGGAIRVTAIRQTIYGVATQNTGSTADDKPFLTNPTRCDNWNTTFYGHAWDNNSNADATIDGVTYKRLDVATAPSCAGIAAFAPSLTLTQTNTQAGRPVGLRAVLDNPLSAYNALQPSYAKSFAMTLPVGFKINPVIANRLGAVGCTEAQFLGAAPVSNTAPTCPVGSQIGTVAVAVPEITGDLLGRLYLGQPQAGDAAAGIYRLYIWASRGGVVVKFQGRAVASPGNGQVVVTINNASSYGTGLPQFNYSKFTLDFDTASAGVGGPGATGVSSPNDNQQMLTNPQVCGTYAASVAITPWTNPTQGITNFAPSLNVTSGTNGSCAFNTFAPTFTANLSDTGAGKHPNMSLTVTRGDRQDNLRDLTFRLPPGFAGSAAAVTPCPAATVTGGTCPVGSQVGSLTVLTGSGPDSATLNGSIFLTDADSTDTAKLAIVVPAIVGPFNLGNVVMYSALRINTTNQFRLDSITVNMPQSIMGIPILYRSVALTFNGIIAGKPFLQNPSVCSVLNFDATITSNGDLSGASLPGTGSIQTSVLNDNNQSTTGCAAQTFNPSLSVTSSTLETAKPSILTFNIGVPQTTTGATGATIQQSTISGVQLTMPTGVEINPAFTNGLVACTTANIDAGGAACAAASQVGTVTVNTPLLSTAVTGKLYIETPGGTAATRYKLGLVLDMPGGKQIIHGSATLDGSSGLTGGLGAKDSGTGQIIATFNGLPDVPYTSMSLAFDGANPMLVNPEACGLQTFSASITPTNGSLTAQTRTAGYTTAYPGACPGSDPWSVGNATPGFSQSVSTAVANAHPNLGLTVTRADKEQKLRDFTIGLPAGLTGSAVAAPTCTQALADAANCGVSSTLGTLAVSIGSGTNSATLNGTLHNTVAPASSPAKFTAIVPVVVGPFDLGKMSIPVDISMRANYGLDASVTNLPQRYEGIMVRYRSLVMTINGMATQGTVPTGDDVPFLTNPSTCGVNTTTAALVSTLSNTVNRSATYTTTGCPQNFGSAPTFSAVPTTTASQAPTGFAITVGSAATNPTIKRIQIAFPSGMEINPATGNGPLTACATATIDAGGAGCPATSNQGTVSINTPLLAGAYTGNVYLETPGTTAATRYKLAIVVHLPGRDLIIHGGATVNGSSSVVAGTGVGSIDTGTGRVIVDFDNIPDLSFSSMALNLTSGSRALFTNPQGCASQSIDATLTPNSGGINATASSNYTTTLNCSTAFTPTFTAALSTSAITAHPNLTLGVTSPDKDAQLRNFNVHLPSGLVANTPATTQCTQANAALGNCAAGQAVGTVTTSIGTGAENLALSGSIYNVVPNANEPARLQAIMPVVVGPFDLGRLTIPVTTSLRADFGVDANTQLPTRYEGIAVRIRSLQMVLSGVVAGQNFMTNPSKCGAASISADMISTTPTTVSGSQAFTFTGCPANYGTAPTLSVTPSTVASQTPVGLTIGVNSAVSNVTTKRIQLTMPAGMEINPAFGNGPLTACAPATVDAGGSGCPATSSVGTVSLTTPLLPSIQAGNVYLETPGATAATRYKLAILVHLPGRDLVVRGAVQVNGSTTFAINGATDSGTGQVTADFDNIPDLGFTNLTIAFAAGNRAMLINPSTCAAQNFASVITPNSGGIDATPSASYTTTTCASTFAPTFTAAVSSAVANAHPNLTLTATSPDKDLQLRNFNVHLPTGLVANTTATTRCSQANAATGSCAAGDAVGTVNTSIGNGGENFALTGTIYNVVSNANEPARLQAVIPVVVGPFDLGKLSIPVTTALRADMGVDANAQLPLRYEGIAVRIRSMQLVLNGVVSGQNFMTNPSKCQLNTITADMISPTPTTVTGSSSFTTTGCPSTYPTNPSLTITPSTTAAQSPVGLTIGVNSAATNPSTKRIQLAMPAGMEINPAFGNGPLTACAPATVDAGGAGCPATSNVGTVNLTTPLLPAVQTGNVYLETPGTTATTRYKLAIVVHLPGRDLIVRGAVQVNGSTTITNVGATDTGTGQVTADFDNIPDLGFTNMTIAFAAGNRAMLINPAGCTAQTFTGTLTPHTAGTAFAATTNYTTTGTCAAGFAPTFSASVSTAAAAGHPNLTLTASSPDTNQQLRNFNVHLPVGLVANTTATTRCSQANAAIGNCAAGDAVGSAATSIGNGGENFALTGTIYNVVPNANEPARLQAVIPVVVGPFDLGKLSIPVTTALRADMGVDANAQLPLRYEGIAVRIRSMQLVLNGVVSGQNFMTNPSKCQVNTITADMISPTPSTVTGTSNFTTTGCPATYAAAPTLTVTPSTFAAQSPVGLTVAVNSAATNYTTKRIQLAMPAGMEINPAFGNGPLTACAPATVDAGGAGCPATSNVGTVNLTTPLLPAVQTGNVYLETPGTTATTRYKLAIVVHLPGRDLIVRGAVQVNGSTTFATNGATDTGTGQVTADFDNIPDLGFTNLTIAFASGNRAMLINPSTCASHTFNSTLTPHAAGADAAPTSAYTTTGSCASTFTPGFSSSVSTTVAGAHPNLTLTATSPDRDQPLRNFNLHLPTGLTANTTATTQCTQANAAIGACAAAQQVGTVTTAIGNGAENFALSGAIYNVVPNANEPARLQAVLPVVVGPFDLGLLSIPVPTTLRADLGVDTTTQLPLRYEGIAVRIRSMQLVLNGVVSGQNFMTNPSKCQVNTITADMISPTPTTVTGTSSFTTTGCPINYGVAPTMTVTPSTTVAQTPTGLTLGFNSAATNVTTRRIQLSFPAGMEINPAFGNGPLTACAPATVDAGGSGCPATSSIGTISLTTPLLPSIQTGNVYLETPGTTAATRYKLAMVAHLPGRDLIVRGAVQVNGSTTITNTGASDSGTGQITADFDNIPDLGWSNLTMAFASGNRAMVVNPSTCAAQTFNGTLTPNSAGANATPTAAYTTTACTSTFAPTFTGSVSTAAAGAHPNLTLTATSPDKDAQLRNFNVHLPTGLVAATTATTQCTQANATIGHCAVGQIVGSVNTSIGNGGENFALSGSIYNVVPNANEPARLQAIIPVVVGPFDLGKLSIPVPTTLRADLGVDTTTQLPLRYEGIAVRIRSMQLVLNGTVGANSFITNPSKCQSNMVSADMISPAPTTVTGSFSFTTTGCPAAFAAAPTLTVTPSTTVAQTPVGLTVAVNSATSNSTIKRLQLAMPNGMEINPGFGNGPLTACAPATVDAGGSSCPATSNVGTVSLSTPLLPTVQTGNVYLETPGATASTRYKLAIVAHLPGRDLIVRGAVQANGSTTITNTGATDSGTGQVTADFDNIPDLGFTNMTIVFASSPHAMLINPSTCAPQTFTGTLTPHTAGADANPISSYSTTACTSNFAPTFGATVSTAQAAAHPNLTLSVTSPDKDAQLRNFNVHLPVGLVANTSVTTQCTQANAAIGNCAAGQIIGTVNTSIGNGGDNYALSGSIYNVVPNSNEPARLQAVIPVVVGPFDLGKLSIPIPTTLRADLGVDTTTQLPLRYEGIAVRIRSMQLALSGMIGANPFITNPSKCGASSIVADMVPATGATVVGTQPINITGCPIGFSSLPTMTVTASSVETQRANGLTIGINSAANNPSISRVQAALPAGMSINPAVGNGLAACTTANINAGGAGCAAGSEMGTVSLVTPLLPGTQTGKIYLETPGTTAATRYKLAIVVNLPSQTLIVHGTAQVDGSTDIAGGTGATGSGTGNVTADFGNIPDLGFTNLTLAFETGDRALFSNPETCAAQTVGSVITPTSGGADAALTASFTTSTGCPGPDGFTPTFTGSVSTTQAAGNPDVTLDVTRSDHNEQLRDFDIELPPGLVANTVSTPRCSQAAAADGSCAPNTVVGTVSTAIGTGTEQLTLSGTINNTVPDPSEPARLTAIIPVTVGPFDLGKLSLPVTTTLVTGSQPSDLRIDTHTTVPQRYEGVPVRVRNLQIVLAGTVAGNGFMINPSSCSTSKDVTGKMISTTGTAASQFFSYTPSNCAAAQFGPTITATPSNTKSGEPVGLSLAFNVPNNSSSVNKIKATLPVGMEISPGIGNNKGGLQTCSTVDVDPDGAGPANPRPKGDGCPAESVLGTVNLDTPLLPTTQTGYVYLEDPVGTDPATRYRMGIVVDLPGDGDLVVHGSATVDGSSDVKPAGPTGDGRTGPTAASQLGAVGAGDGQVVAEFNNLPDLQFSELEVNFYTGDAQGHTSLLTNPTSCGTQTVSAELSPWSSPATVDVATDSFTTSYDGAGAPCPGTIPQNPSMSASLSGNLHVPNGDAYKAGVHADVTMTVSRPDRDQGIRKAKIFLPVGLVGSAAAAPTCLDEVAALGNCEEKSRVGDVALTIGSGSETYQLNGTIFNVVAPSNRPAKLSFAARVLVGPFNLGRVVVPVDINLDPNDYSLSAETGLMPQSFEGVPVRIRELAMHLDGYADQGTATLADDVPFMSNPRTCAATPPSIRADLTSPINYPDNVANVSGQLAAVITGCENLNLDDNTLQIANTPTDAQKPTKLEVTVTQGITPNQATLKDFTIALPGFRLNAPAADNLATCSATQLTNQAEGVTAPASAICPLNSKVGTAWIDTSLLPIDQAQNPLAPAPPYHSLWGTVYLETPGTAADGSDRYKLAIQLSGKTVITIRGTAVVNETTGDITTRFTGLPDIPFENFNVKLDGATNPLLLNPETCGTSTAATAMTPWSGAVKNFNSPLSVTNCTAHPFAPTVAANLSTHAAGAHPKAIFTISRDDDDLDLKAVNMTLPAGFLGSAAAVPQCALAVAAAGNCSSSSAVGTVVARIGQNGQTLTLPGTAYLTDGVNGDIAGMSIKIRAIAGPYDLGDYVTQGRIVLRPSDHGIDVNFDNIPQLFKGVPTRIQNLEITLPGRIGDTPTGKPFLYNASSCEPMNITGTMTSYSNTTATNNVPYQATNCAPRSFAPTMSFDATGGSSTSAPAWTIKMGLGDGNSTMKYTKVLLPSIMTVNIQGLGTVCEPDAAAAHACPAATSIGDVSISTPLLPAPVTGTVYVARTVTGSTLPDLLIELPAPINMQIRGANSFFNNIQIQSTFDNLPDLVWGDITMHINGGPKGLLGLRANGKCGPAITNFASWSGQAMNAESPVTGISNCANQDTVCNTPTVVTSTKGGVKKKGNKKLKTTTTLKTETACSPIKSFSVLYPKGSKINKKQLKYNKKLKKTKKNLKNLTGKAGNKKLVATDFQITGKNGVKIKKPLTGDVHQISISSQLSTVLLPYKTFCGAITGKGKAYKTKLKKCQAKTVTYTFVITRQDGSVLRYDHKVKAGDKKFK